MSDKTTGLTVETGKYAAAALNSDAKRSVDSSVQTPVERTVTTKRSDSVLVRITTRPASVDRKTSE